ncbi:hypothetical protein PR048_000841 [Dryococelus australis]|uniref:CHK kinase-like domain-containing protein n=1 Tax=Dryococelus australis TaxID=614101 RepID=A0ABQ9II40_9NEOP|nr:hypothetical protein PR048_000841 [Dryococelus australis]
MENTSPKPWMDKAWLQKVIRDVEKDKYLLVTEHCVKSMGAKGDNYLSIMQRINARIQWSDNTEGEIFMVVKNIPPGKEMQKTLMASTAFPNEIKIFSKILPKFQEILNKAALGKFLPFGARYICSEDSETRFLIVGDLAAEGFRMAKRQGGLDMDHCILLLKTLGRYHATSIALHEVNPSIVESFKENMFTEESSKEFICNFTKMTLDSISKIVRTWPECGERMAGKLELLTSVFHSIVKEQFKQDGNRLNVLTHGDLWINNMMFRYDDETGAVQDIRLVDFQMSRYTSFAMDLQYFIHTSPTDTIRARHVEGLLKEYHKELSNTLHLLGQDHRIISFHEVVEEYEKKNVFGFLMSLLLLPIVQADPEDAVDLEAFIGGNDESSGMCSRVGNTEFMKVMKRILPIYEERGYF